jgi:hypothetical protein
MDLMSFFSKAHLVGFFAAAAAGEMRSICFALGLECSTTQTRNFFFLGVWSIYPESQVRNIDSRDLHNSGPRCGKDRTNLRVHILYTVFLCHNITNSTRSLKRFEIFRDLEARYAWTCV